ncbi:hypothetical protein DFH06DRAFT_1147429 [Mycena polygramma]|nr:hypothetical protein DFH06DRAFT_1147429 [Mycena polygramma]
MVYTRVLDGQPQEADEAACVAFLRHVEELQESEVDSRYFVIEQKYGERKYFKSVSAAIFWPRCSPKSRLEYLGPSQSALVGWPHPLRQTFRPLTRSLETLISSISFRRYREPEREPISDEYWCFWNLDVNFVGGPHHRSMRIPDIQFVYESDNRERRRIVLDCGVGQAPHYLRDKFAMWCTRRDIEIAVAIDLQAAQFTAPKTKPIDGAHHWTYREVLEMERAPLSSVILHGHCWAQGIEKVIFSIYTSGRTETFDLTLVRDGDVQAEARLDSAQHSVAFLIGRAAKRLVGGWQFKECFTKEHPFDMNWAKFYREIHRGQAILAHDRYSSWHPNPDPRAGFSGSWP